MKGQQSFIYHHLMWNASNGLYRRWPRTENFLQSIWARVSLNVSFQRFFCSVLIFISIPPPRTSCSPRLVIWFMLRTASGGPNFIFSFRHRKKTVSPFPLGIFYFCKNICLPFRFPNAGYFDPSARRGTVYLFYESRFRRWPNIYISSITQFVYLPNPRPTRFNSQF